MADRGLEGIQFTQEQLLGYRQQCENAFCKVLELEGASSSWKLRNQKGAVEVYELLEQAREFIGHCQDSHDMYEKIEIGNIRAPDLCTVAEVYINQEHQKAYSSYFRDFERRDITSLVSSSGSDWIVGGKIRVKKVLLQHWSYSGQWPMRARDFVVIVAFGWSMSDGGLKLYMAQESTSHPQIPENKRFVRGLIRPSGAIISQVPGSESNPVFRICLLNSVSFRGMVPDWVLRKLSSYGLGHYQSLKDYIESCQSVIGCSDVLVTPCNESDQQQQQQQHGGSTSPSQC